MNFRGKRSAIRETVTDPLKRGRCDSVAVYGEITKINSNFVIRIDTDDTDLSFLVPYQEIIATVGS
ncbi:hypothetical protein SAMN06264867_109150 [Halorubrum cibi]|uniref:Uncharacterized protein n=1 Tax=Halorubrum cibi TaxID=413815 RepID=A0A521E8M2_9EURY|nr:hypothetical protein SAMN06264867_109150 [Halorubrum cibi]